ncbi:MAG: hypothetical protein R3E01_04905 [Pirellulaceae bacterium]|nr:hypothetical protein [Planctomycetales bacterium]
MATVTPVQYRAPTLLRMSAGFVYFFFGVLRFFPDLSPGEMLASQTIMRLTGHLLSAADALWWLAIMLPVVKAGWQRKPAGFPAMPLRPLLGPESVLPRPVAAMAANPME